MTQTTPQIIDTKKATEYWKSYALESATKDNIKVSVDTQLWPLTLLYIKRFDGTVFSMTGSWKIILFENGRQSKDREDIDQIREGWLNKIFAPAASLSKFYEHIFTGEDAKHMNTSLDLLFSSLKFIQVALPLQFNYEYVDNRLKGEDTILFAVKPFTWFDKGE